MNDMPMWSLDPKGYYCLLFPNKHGLTKNEISSIFSQFGKVKKITEAGNEKGLRFVQYASTEEAERAVANLKNHPTIKLVPYRSKKNNIQNSDDPLKDKKDSVASKLQLNSTDTNRNFYQRKPVKKNTAVLDKDNASVCSNNIKYVTKCVESNSPSNKSLADPVQKLHKNADIYSNIYSASNSSNNNCSYSTAEEVIVANIHNDYGSAYILHLFEQFQPIAVSSVNILPKTGIRYCHIFFQTTQDCIEVETRFDRYNLAGKELVVLRRCQLLKEGRP